MLSYGILTSHHPRRPALVSGLSFQQHSPGARPRAPERCSIPEAHRSSRGSYRLTYWPWHRCPSRAHRVCGGTSAACACGEEDERIQLRAARVHWADTKSCCASGPLGSPTSCQLCLRCSAISSRRNEHETTLDTQVEPVAYDGAVVANTFSICKRPLRRVNVRVEIDHGAVAVQERARLAIRVG